MTEFEKAYKAFSNLSNNWWDQEASHYEETYEEDPCQLKTNELQEHDYKNIRILHDYFIKGDQ